MQFRLLGVVDAVSAGQPVDLGHARLRCVLAVLLVEANRIVPVDQLIERVWGDHPPRGRGVLYGYLSRLRTVVAHDPEVTIQHRRGGYLITVDEAFVDLHRFRRLITAARQAEQDSDGVGLFDQALGLWQGTPFADLDTAWLATVRTALELEHRDAELDRTDAALRCGQHAHLLADLCTRTRQHPLDERLAGQYMLALYRCDRIADALTHYHHTRDHLATELGVDPSQALQELHEHVLRNDPQLDVTTSPPTPIRPPTPRQLPALTPHFVGRAVELRHLSALLDTASGTAVGADTADTGGGTVVISAIGGTGGIGKTWLALTWAHRNLHHFPDGQLAADLRGFSPGSPREAVDVLAEFLAALGVDRDRHPQDLDARVALYRTHTTGKRLLILLDNAADADQVIPLLPGGTTCTVLITSRNRLRSLIARHSAYPLQLDVLTDTDAHTVLTHALGTTPTAHARHAVTELTRLCKGFPLALGLIAARIRTHPYLLDDLVTDLRELGVGALDSDDPTASLPIVLSWSLRQLTRTQRTLFGLLGIAPGPDTTVPAAACLTDLPQEGARAALSTLEDASLLERRPGGRYVMHDLVRDYAAATTSDFPNDVRETALVRVMDFYLHTAFAADRLLDPHRPLLHPDPALAGVQPHPLVNPTVAMSWLEAEHTTLLATQRAARALSRHSVVWHFAWILDTFHYLRGHRRAALAVWQTALEAAACLSDPTTRIRTHRRLGIACSRLGLHEEATEHLNQALDVAVRHHDTTEQAHTHRVLAVAWTQQEDNQRALDHARHALDLYRTLDQPVPEADALNAVGWSAARLGEFDTARDHCNAALILHRYHHNPEGESTALDSLGFIAHHTGEHQQALDHYRLALIQSRTHGNTSQVAQTLDNMGHPHVALGQHEDARIAWQEALEMYEEQGRDTDAQRVQQQLAKLDKDSTGTDHDTK